MTSKFRIDKPGVYKRRDGEKIFLWPTFCTTHWEWVQLCGEYPMSYLDDGRYLVLGCNDIGLEVVAYVSPFPSEILQQMADALASAGYHPQDTAPAMLGEGLQSQ